MIKKLKSQRGFSLAETLLAVLILLLVSVIVANGMPAVQSAYEKVVIGANAKVLLSTTISSLRNELATATKVKVDGTTISYYSADKGATSEISINVDGEIPGIKLKEYSSADPTDFAVKPSAIYKDKDIVRNLVSDQAATGDLYVTYESITPYKPGDESITIKGLKVSRKSNGTVLATTDLTIRFIIPAKADEEE